jgi:serine protease Do
VTEFDGNRVSNARALIRLVAETPPGRTVDVTVLRDGRARTLSVTPTLGRVQVDSR